MYVHYLGWIFLLSALPSPSKKQKNSHGSHTETMGAAGHCLYRRLWLSGAGSNLWRVLIGSWVMPPLTGSIAIEGGGEKTLYFTTAEMAAIVVVAATATATAMMTTAAAAAEATAMAKALEMMTTMA